MSIKKQLFFVAMLCGIVAYSQNISVNQLGFYPTSYKIAVVPASVSSATFTLVDAANNQTVFTGTLGAAALWKPAAQSYRLADFSAFVKEGNYYVKAGTETSYQFAISNNIFEDPTQGLIRAFYFWRSSTAIVQPYSLHKGTDYARAAGHLDNSVEVSSEAASSGRPSGTKFSCSKGWYDAGDYGKYVVSGSVAAYFLLTAYENNQDYMTSLSLNIPESKNTLPDILDEAKWEIDWFLEDIDPTDGGVYNRVTTSWFAGMNDMPATDNGQRYAYKKSTPSNLDYAAVMAVAYRVFKPFDPTYADKCLAASLKAWKWARKNPAIATNGSGGTGQYDDSGFNDELAWAANELYIATKADSFYVATQFLKNSFVVLEEPSWQKTNCLGLLSLVNNLDQLTPVANKQAIKDKFLNFADSLCLYWDSSAYKVMTNRYWWGINSVVGAQGVIFANAYTLTHNKRFLNAALSQYDYLFGRNPLNQSYITWYGDKSPLHPHDRRSNGDGITLPQPGYVVGGANNDCSCTGSGPALKYHDEEGDYAVNEVAVNYSGPAVSLAAHLASAYKYTGSRALSAQCTTVPTSITIALSAGINPASFNNQKFSLLVNGVSQAISSFAIGANNKTINLSLATGLLPTDTAIYLSLADTTILALDGFKLLPFSKLPVQNFLPGAPLKLISSVASTNGSKIILTFDKNLATPIPASPASFTVLINGYSVAISAVAIGSIANTLEIILSQAIKGSEEVNVLYDGIAVINAQDTGILLPFGAKKVKNPIDPVLVKTKGFRDDFNDNTKGTYLVASSGASITAETGEYMTLACNATYGYNHLVGTLPAMDITANPKFTIRFKAAKDFTLRVDLGSVVNGTIIYTNSGTATKQQAIKASPDFQTVVFTYTDWSGQYPVGTVDKTNITLFSLMFNAGGTFTDNVTIDYIAIGDAPLSSESHLASLALSGNTLSPAFDSSVYAYTVSLPADATIVPAITATALSSKASLVLSQASSTTGSATAIVTAEDGSKRKYTVQYILAKPAAQQTINLQQGWNLVSISVVPPSLATMDVFAPAKNAISCIKNSTAYYLKTNPLELNTLTSLRLEEAYLVFATAATSFTIVGNKPAVVKTNLSAGWNMVGAPLLSPKPCSSLPTEISLIKNLSDVYIPNSPLSTLSTLSPGQGYFIQSTTSGSIVW